MPSSTQKPRKGRSVSSVSAKRPRKSAQSTSLPGVAEQREEFAADDLPWTPEMIKRLRPMDRETVDFINRARGRPPAADPKQAVSLRLDSDVIAYFKKGGAGWQSRINSALRSHAKLGRK